MDKSTADLDIFLSNSSVSDLGKLVLEWPVKAHDSLDEFRCFDSFVQTLAVQQWALNDLQDDVPFPFCWVRT